MRYRHANTTLLDIRALQIGQSPDVVDAKEFENVFDTDARLLRPLAFPEGFALLVGALQGDRRGLLGEGFLCLLVRRVEGVVAIHVKAAQK